MSRVAIRTGAGCYERVPHEASVVNQDQVLELVWREISALAAIDAHFEAPGYDQQIFELALDSLSVGALSGSIRRETGVGLDIAALLVGDMRIRDLALSLTHKMETARPTSQAAESTQLFLKKPISETSVARGAGWSGSHRIAMPIVFVLSSPRSGSTLFQFILNTHSLIWGPQELLLIPFSTMGEWRQWLWDTAWAEGLIAAVLQVY
jgi:hypothetical protein